jgi:hypothetical protein
MPYAPKWENERGGERERENRYMIRKQRGKKA